MLAQSAWLPVLRTLGMRHFTGGSMLVAGAVQVFDEHGKLVDDQVRDRLAKFVAGFIAFVER